MRIVVRVLFVLIAISLIAWFGGRAYLARSVAPREGTIATDANAEITFDAKGIPQIWAKTDGDAYFAIGWLHASDRLFQMELVRRLSRGELSEVFGEAAYEADVHQRQIGFARRANASKLTPAARLALQRYVDGVNAKAIANGRTWGEACTLTIRHPLARVKVLDWFLDLDRGPFPGWGDPGTLNANFFSYRDDTKSFHARLGASMRFVLDWSDVDAFSLSGALGQSGNPFSPHYDDFLGVTEWNVPFTREKVFAGAKSVVRLRR